MNFRWSTAGQRQWKLINNLYKHRSIIDYQQRTQRTLHTLHYLSIYVNCPQFRYYYSSIIAVIRLQSYPTGCSATVHMNFILFSPCIFYSMFHNQLYKNSFKWNVHLVGYETLSAHELGSSDGEWEKMADARNIKSVLETLWSTNVILGSKANFNAPFSSTIWPHICNETDIRNSHNIR